ncbi:hypothetical protein [Poriferisphaera sp. WC338]|uniref:hypothetical protein n=1 Tax=Poriferisphaera sp. WC338 TaxID=3425129 RepID=UPI003D819862
MNLKIVCLHFVLLLFLSGCASGPVVKRTGDVGEMRTVTVAGGEAEIRESLKAALREQGWQIVRFGRVEDRHGRIDEAETISGADEIWVAHYLDVNAVALRKGIFNREQKYWCEINLYGLDPDREIVTVTGRGTKVDLIGAFVSAIEVPRE